MTTTRSHGIRPALLVLVLLVAGCHPDALMTPAPEAAPDDGPQAVWQAEGAAAPAGTYLFTKITGSSVLASGQGINCPANKERASGTYTYELTLSQAAIDDLNATLGGGGTATVNFTTESFLVSLGNGSGHLGARIQVLLDTAAGLTHQLARVSESRQGPPVIDDNVTHHELALDQADVDLMSDGDVLRLYAFGTTAADAGGCDNTDQAITEWEFSNATPTLTTTP